MSFKQLEAKFQRNLNEYKSTYQDYMVDLNNSRGTYWNTEENVTVSNKGKGAMIPFLTEPDITKSKCLHACSSDPRCQYVLFSDSGNGECAANQCLKWTKEAGGIIKAQSKPQFFNIFVGSSNSRTKTITLPDTGITVYPSAINAQNPAWSDRFSVDVFGTELTVTRSDENSGWGQQLQLQGIKDSSGFKEYDINVGSSSSNPKVITLPTTGLTVSPTPTNPQNPDWNNTFNISVSGDQLTVTRTDMNSGWGQNLQLRGGEGNNAGFLLENKGCAPGQGPSSTNYVYSGWEKPSWKDSNNISFMGDPDNANPAEWKDLGSASNLVACKDMSITSSDGPFSSVVFVSQQNKCFGGIPSATQSMTKMEGVYSSIPPMGSTNMGGSSALVYVEKLQNLNNALKNNLMQMRELMDNQKSKDVVGTLSGEWIPSPLRNIKPIQNTDIPGLWVFAGYDGVYVKMVGMMYGMGSGNSQPQRVDGRAMKASGNQSIINRETIPYLWKNASIKDIGDQQYTLTIRNKKTLEKARQNINSDYHKLNKDRVKLDEMQRELNNLDVKLGLLDTATTREKFLYMGSAAAVLILIFAFIFRKSS